MMKFRQELINLARIGQFKGVTRRLLPKLVIPTALLTTLWWRAS